MADSDSIQRQLGRTEALLVAKIDQSLAHIDDAMRNSAVFQSQVSELLEFADPLVDQEELPEILQAHMQLRQLQLLNRLFLAYVRG